MAKSPQAPMNRTQREMHVLSFYGRRALRKFRRRMPMRAELEPDLPHILELIDSLVSKLAAYDEATKDGDTRKHGGA